MLRNGLSRRLIANIPTYLGGEGIKLAKGDYKQVIELIPVRGTLVDYRSDIWDFTDGFRYQRRSQLRIRFYRANPEYKDMLKDYIVQLLDSFKWKISTLSSVASIMVTILNRAYEMCPYDLFVLVDTDNIIDAINETQTHPESRRNAYTYVIPFVSFVAEHHAVFLPIDLETLNRELILLGDAYSSSAGVHHHQNIPDSFYQSIITICDRVMRDEHQPFNMRMTGGIILMDSQLGLRSLEIPALEKDCIQNYRCSDKKTRHYCIYNSIKPAKADVEAIKVKTICTDLLYQTWVYMLDLRKKGEFKNKTDFMYILDAKPYPRPNPDKFPISQGSMIYMIKCFFGRYLMEYIEKDWRGISRVKLPNMPNAGKFSIPTIHNFRVRFATTLYRQGFPLDFIESIMSHSPHSETYDAYYDVDDIEFRRAQQTLHSNKPSEYVDPEEEFDAFLNDVDDY